MDPFQDVVESYYLETQEGLFFAVKGLEHPPERVIAVLRFAPDPERGDRKKAERRYRRLYHFAEQEQLIRSSYPQYLAYDPIFQTTLQSVPKSLIRRIHDPRARLREMAELPAKSIEEDAVAFTDLIQQESGIPSSAIGISGSLLISLDAERSDLDVSVFGMQNCRQVYDALRRLLDSAPDAAGPRRLDVEGIEELYRQRAATRISFRDFMAMELNKVCQGSFRQRPYFIRFIKEPHETAEKYGDVRYATLGRATITANVTDDRESIFTPCRYGLSDVRILEGPVAGIGEIVSFRGRFCEQARMGESVRAGGTLERVENRLGVIRYRLLLGNFPEDMMAGC